MERIQLLDRVSDYLAVLSSKIHIENHNNEYNINIHAENIMLKILEIVYDCNLSNANFISKNYPAIDLVDFERKIGFQITSTPTNSKIISTLETAVKYYLNSEIKELKIFILSRKLQNKTYIRASNKYNDILDGKITFNPEQDIIDSSSIYKELNKSNDLEKISKVVDVLEDEFERLPIITKSRFSVYLHFSEDDCLLAIDVTKRLIESGITVFSNSFKLFENLKGTLYNALFSYLDKGSLPHHVHYVASLVTSSYLELELENRRSLLLKGKIFFTYIIDIKSNELKKLETNHPPFFFRKNNSIKIASNCIEKIIEFEDGIEIHNDLETILKNFRPNDTFIKVKEELIKKKGIGYELYAQVTENNKIVEYFLYLKAQGELFNNKLNRSNVYSFIKEKKYPLTVLVPKANHLKNPKNRFSAIKNLYRDSDVYFIDEFAWQKCNTLSMKNSEKGSYLNIDNFVLPYMDELDIDGNKIGRIESDEVSNWFNLKNEPILVFAGIGGIGKTTLAQKYSDYFQKRNKSVGVLFIESENIIRKLQLFELNHKEFDLYNFYIASISNDNIGEEKLSKEMFQFHFDNGRILVIIDGLDEVISRVAQFNISEFVESIKQNNIKNGYGKVILTCRKFFWIQEKSTRSNVLSIEILPFDKEKARLFFSERNYFPNYQKKCMKFATSLSLKNKDKEEFIPFVLDVVSNMVEEQIESFLEDDINFEDGYQITNLSLLNFEEPMDYVMFHICERETIRSKQVKVKDQIKIFIQLCINENGIIKLDKLNAFIDKLEISLNDNQKKALLAHPLLYTKNDKIVFRYDFLDQYFKSLFLSKYLNFDNDELISSEIINVISECRYNSGISSEYSNRKKVLWDENTSLKFSNAINEIKNKYPKTSGVVQKNLVVAIGGLVTLALTILHKSNGNNVRNNTELIKKIFEVSPNKLDGLILTNIIDNVGSGIKFNFEGLTIINGTIESYDDFWLCKFNKETKFIGSTFKNLNNRTRNNFSAHRDNFISSIDLDESLEKSFKLKYNNSLNKESRTSISLQQFLKTFYSAGKFRIKDSDYDLKKVYNSLDYKPTSNQNLIEILKIYLIQEHFSSNVNNKKYEIKKDAKQSVMKFCQEGTKRSLIKKTILRIMNN